MGKRKAPSTSPSKNRQGKNHSSSQFDEDEKLILEFFHDSEHSITMHDWWNLWKRFKETIDKLGSIEQKVSFSYQFLADFNQEFLPGGSREAGRSSYGPDPRECRQKIQIEIDMWEKQLSLQREFESTSRTKGGVQPSNATAGVSKINWTGRLIDLVRLLEKLRVGNKLGHSSDEMLSILRGNFIHDREPISDTSLKTYVSSVRKDLDDKIEFPNWIDKLTNDP